MSKVIKILVYLLSSLILVSITVPLLLMMMLQIPVVQNFIVDKATEVISNKLETKIAIGRVDIKLFNRVVIEDLYVQDYQQDTLLYASKIDVAIRTLGLGFKSDEMHLGNVRLSDVKFYLIQRAPGESNLKQILNRLKSKKPKPKSDKKFILKVDELNLDGMHFVHTKLAIPPREYGINFADIDIENLFLAAKDIVVIDDDISMQLNKIALHEKCGLEIEKLSAQKFNISGKGIFFSQANIRMNHSNLNFDHLRLHSGSWAGYSDFINDVRMEARMVDSDIAFASIAYFAPSLRTWKTTVNNATITLDGTIAKMSGQVIKASTLNTKIALRYEITGIPNIEVTRFKLLVDDIQTSAEDLNTILSDITGKQFMQPNKILDRLAHVGVKGSFDGKINDFVAIAALQTPFGNAELHTNMKRDRSGATTIKGDVKVNNFNAGGLLQVKDLGHVSLNTNVDGHIGGTSNINLKSVGKISALQFNGYQYSDINMDGVMNGKMFTGHLSSKDSNMDFDFDGMLDFSSNVPSYDFDLKLINANLAKLNINKRDTVSQLRCHIIADFSGTSLNDVNGRAEIRDLEYVNHIDTVRTGSITLTGQNSADSKYLALNSSFADMSFRSRMSYDTLINYITHTMDLYLPTLRKTPQTYVAGEKKEFLDVKDYSLMTMSVKQANNLSSIFLPGLHFASGTQLSVMANPQAEQIAISAKSDYIEYNNSFISGLNINTRNQGDSLALYVGAEDVYAGGVYMPNFSIIGGAKENTINVSTRFNNPQSGSEVLLGVMSALERNPQTGAPQVKINIKPSFMSNRTQTWRIMARSIVYDTSKIVVNNFRISSSDQELRINGTASRNANDTISLSLSNFDLAPLTQFMSRMGYSISGTTSGSASMASALKGGFMTANIDFDSVKLNNTVLPPTRFESRWDFQRERARVILARKDVADTLLVGYYRPTDQRYRVDVDMNGVDMSLLDPLLKGVISNTTGGADLAIQMIGEKNKMEFNGQITVPQLSTKVDFLNVPYTINNGMVKVVDSKLTLQQVKIHDPNGNSADFDMMLDLSNFANMKYNLRIRPENLMVLNTSDADNDLFFGKVFASGLATIAGDKRGIKMDIAATTAGNSQFFLPLSGKSNASRANFITFEQTNKPSIDSSNILHRKKLIFQRTQKQNTKANEVRSNMNINMALNVKPNTELQVVIDPTVGDIIKARGNGTLNIRINPNNNVFAMYGDYEISEGSYLFTLQNIINKKFVIDPGSMIKWTGDPIDALLDITAIYKLKASLAPLDPEMRGTVPVDCEIMLSDRLSHPTVTFGVKLPNATPEVQSIIANQINTQEMMATQFFWLLAVNSFFADSNTSGSSNIGAVGGSATGFEFLSNQISNWISSDKFNIGIRYRPRSELTSEEVNVDFSTQLFSNRLLLEVEGNYDSGNNPTMANKSVNNLTGDFYLTWLIDRAGNLKAKVFSRTMDSFDENQGLQENGIGIYYNENFNTFNDIINNLRERLSIKGRELRKQKRDQRKEHREQEQNAVSGEVKRAETEQVNDDGTN